MGVGVRDMCVAIRLGRFQMTCMGIVQIMTGITVSWNLQVRK